MIKYVKEMKRLESAKVKAEEYLKPSRASMMGLFVKKVKVGLSPSKKSCFICFYESPLKMLKNAFNFIVKALLVLKILKFLSWLFVHVEKQLD